MRRGNEDVNAILTDSEPELEKYLWGNRGWLWQIFGGEIQRLKERSQGWVCVYFFRVWVVVPQNEIKITGLQGN